MISRIANLISDLEGLWFLLTLTIGIGVLGYLGVSWFLHFAISAHYLAAFTLAALLLTSVALALLRIPLAQIVVLGGAIISGTAFVLGYGNALLP